MNDKMIAKGIDKAIALLSGEGHDTLGESEELRTRAVLLLIDLADELDPPQTRRDKAGLPEPTVVPKVQKIEAGQVWETPSGLRRTVTAVFPDVIHYARGDSSDPQERVMDVGEFLSASGKVVGHSKARYKELSTGRFA